MAVNWTVTGQASQGWDTTSRSLEYYAVSSAVMQFSHMAADNLRLTVTAKNIWAATLPSYGQTVALFRDGTRYFTGRVSDLKTSVRGQAHVAEITISGPWDQLQKVPIVANRTSPAGNSGTRQSATYSGNTDILGSMVYQLLLVYGSGICTVSFNDIATGYLGPTITLNQMAATQAIGELMRLVPDAVIWFDYANATPAAKITRRGVATAATLTIGTSPISDIELNPIDGMLVDRVFSPYAIRAANGAMEYAISSTSSLGNGGANQYYTASGPELDTFIPPDLLDSCNLWYTTPNTSEALMFSVEAGYSYYRTYNEILPYTSTNVRSGVSYWSNGQGATITTYTSLGTSLPSGTRAWFFGTTGRDAPPDWLIKKYGLYQWQYGFSVWWTDFQGTLFNQARRDALLKFLPQDYWMTYYDGSPQNYLRIWCSGPWSGPKLWLSTQAPPPLGIIYKDPDYTFRTPNAFFLDGLRDAQAYVPYEGTITLTEENVGATRYRDKVINVSGALAAYTNMRALVRSETLDLMAGTTTLELGPPPRNDIRTLVDKVRKTPQDNIIPA